MAAKKDDPTVTSGSSGPEFPEGTHPARPASEVTHAASKLEYRELSDKPDSSSVAQEQVLQGDEATGK